jgi:DNA-binding MltR family transcriptional regulator
MKQNILSPFDDQKIVDLLLELIDHLTEESGRGAVLIAAAKLEDYLTELIQAILPLDGKNYKSKLFNFTGPLGTFSSKIELAFAFRLISKSFYDSLQALRKIRNDAAHSPEKFTLSDLDEKLSRFYNLGPHVPAFIRNQALMLLVELKNVGLNQILDELNVSGDLERQKHTERYLGSEDAKAMIKHELPQWQLAYGVSLLCGFLNIERIRLSGLIKEEETWSSVLMKESDEND